jgi:Domain of unknown function (DUF4917)
VEQANEALAADLFPVFVAEGESKQKLAKIQHSAYLHHSYKSFCTEMQGANKALFVYGHSLAENDRHIFHRSVVAGWHTCVWRIADLCQKSVIRHTHVGIEAATNDDDLCPG